MHNLRKGNFEMNRELNILIINLLDSITQTKESGYNTKYIETLCDICNLSEEKAIEIINNGILFEKLENIKKGIKDFNYNIECEKKDIIRFLDLVETKEEKKQVLLMCNGIYKVDLEMLV